MRPLARMALGPAACVAALLSLAVAITPRAAFAHEPFEITTDARAQPDGLTLHVTLASRTATLACPGVVGEVRSLRADDFVARRPALEACAKELYVVTNVGRVLAPRAALVSLTQEGDFDARLRYDPALPGRLTFDAVHLTRIPDPMFGAELTVTGAGVFLGQTLLRAKSHTLNVTIPEATANEPLPRASASGTTDVGGSASTSTAQTRDEPAAPGAYLMLAGALALLAGLVWLGRRLLR